MALSQLSRSIRGKAALVTGAASGIGRATARLFADEGAKLALVDRDGDALAVLGEEILAAGGEVLLATADLADRDAVVDAVTRAIDHYDGLDILVNNAGLALLSGIADESYPESWELSMGVMAGAQAWAVRAALPALENAEHPRIINLASTEALSTLR